MAKIPTIEFVPAGSHNVADMMHPNGHWEAFIGGCAYWFSTKKEAEEYLEYRKYLNN